MEDRRGGWKRLERKRDPIMEWLGFDSLSWFVSQGYDTWEDTSEIEEWPKMGKVMG